MYWPLTTARRLHLATAGLDQLPAQLVPTSQDDDGGDHDEAAPLRHVVVGPQPDAPVLDLVRSPSSHHFLHLTPHTLAVWSTRPAHVLAALRRTHLSVDAYGENVSAVWREDGNAVAIKTSKSFLLLYDVHFDVASPQPIYSYVPTNGSGSKSTVSGQAFAPSLASLRASFHAAPGESDNVELGAKGPSRSSDAHASSSSSSYSTDAALPPTTPTMDARSVRVHIDFVLGLRIDAGVACMSAAYRRLVISTLSPPAMQCIDWPTSASSSSSTAGGATTQSSTKTVRLEKLAWVARLRERPKPPPPPGGRRAGDGEGEGETREGDPRRAEPTRTTASAGATPYVVGMAHSRALDCFVWLTSDGRAYLATLRLEGPSEGGEGGDEPGGGRAVWTGRCFYHGPGGRSRRPTRRGMGRRRGSAMTGSTGGASEVEEDNASSVGVGAAAGAGGAGVASSADEGAEEAVEPLPAESRARVCAINAKFSLATIGLADGRVLHYTLRGGTGAGGGGGGGAAAGATSTERAPALPSHSLDVREALRSTASYLRTGEVRSLAWTHDGHALAVGCERGWTVWSAFGKLMGCSLLEEWDALTTTAAAAAAVASATGPATAARFSDHFMRGARRLFWGPGSTELFVLAELPDGTMLDADAQLFSLPFAKSAVTGQHSPDNTRFAFIQLDESVLVYRGSEQPDMSVINPESDVWAHIKIPESYLANNWPIRYACISTDGRLIAVAGRRGLAHYSSLSGRWKTFDSVVEEQSFAVRGGLQWYQHVLVAAVQSGATHQIRLYSRDAPRLDERHVLFRETLPDAVVLTSLFDNSLLVYTADNTLLHYLIEATDDGVALVLCGSITFEGVVAEPARVRSMSWMVPPNQQRYGDPMDDLTMASIIFLIDGKLVLLRPRRSAAPPHGAHPHGGVAGGGKDEEEDELDEVAYDMQVLGDRIEYYWTHLSGVGTLENSLWGYDGRGIKLWLDALTIERAEPRRRRGRQGVGQPGGEEGKGAPAGSAGEEGRDHDEEEERQVAAAGYDDDDGDGSDESDDGEDEDEDEDEEERPEYKTIEESLSVPLDFYPLCVLIEKGIVIGVEPEVSLRKSLDFAIFRSSTSTHLFLHHVLRHYLQKSSLRHAVLFASYYQSLVYFGHALEVLLHGVLEDEADSLPTDGHLGPAPPTDFAVDGGKAMAVVGQSDATATPGGEGGGGGGAAPQLRPGAPPGALLPLVIAFLDHFDDALDVVVGCARKTEVARWPYLFACVGEPRELFERCVSRGTLETAGSYLMVLHNVESRGESTAQTVRLLRMAAERHNWDLCRQLLRFVRSTDEGGAALRQTLRRARLLPEHQRLGVGGEDEDEDNDGGGGGASGEGASHDAVEDEAEAGGARTPTRRPRPPLLTVSAARGGGGEDGAAAGVDVAGAVGGQPPRSVSAPDVLEAAVAATGRGTTTTTRGEEEGGVSPTSGGAPASSSSSPSQRRQQQQRPPRSASLLSLPASSAPVAQLNAHGRVLSSSSSLAPAWTRSRTGLGMSLSKVGLGSSDRVWELGNNTGGGGGGGGGGRTTTAAAGPGGDEAVVSGAGTLGEMEAP